MEAYSSLSTQILSFSYKIIKAKMERHLPFLGSLTGQEIGPPLHTLTLLVVLCELTELSKKQLKATCPRPVSGVTCP